MSNTNNPNTYNGWTNYQTWVVNLWFDNDGMNETFEDWAIECVQSEIDDEAGDAEQIRANARYELAKRIEEWADEMRDSDAVRTPGMFGDLLTHSLGMVDWQEIADHYTDEVSLWVCGYNMPGCLPDSDPVFFIEFEDAQSSIVETMKGHADEMGESCTSESESLLQLADAFEESKEQELSQQGSNGLVYWINKA
jgi:hypothetical protein